MSRTRRKEAREGSGIVCETLNPYGTVPPTSKSVWMSTSEPKLSVLLLMVLCCWVMAHAVDCACLVAGD